MARKVGIYQTYAKKEVLPTCTKNNVYGIEHIPTVTEGRLETSVELSTSVVVIPAEVAVVAQGD